MRRLNKLKTLLLVFALPTVLRLITLPFDNVLVFAAVTALTYGLLSLWYFGLLTAIKEKTEITRTEELTIKAFLIWLLIYPVIAVILFKQPHTGIPILLVVGNIMFAALGLISLYLMTLNFEKLFTIRNEKGDRLLIFILLAVYPIGIWRYHDKIKVNKEK